MSAPRRWRGVLAVIVVWSWLLGLWFWPAQVIVGMFLLVVAVATVGVYRVFAYEDEPDPPGAWG